ncbi:response regulator [Aliiroseovarius sp. YM-037]|uniref:response regulator n=1 Tax=Aliiroseovarius sp. YM-037 TaxID=3341728 RepID=UPI003A800BC7
MEPNPNSVVVAQEGTFRPAPPDHKTNPTKRHWDAMQVSRILVVEDEVLVALETADLIGEFGLEVVGPAIRLTQAEELARAENFEFALLDVNLGQGTTSKSIAGILRERDIPFAFVTAYEPSQIPFLKPGDKVVSKPFSSQALREMLDGFGMFDDDPPAA